MKEEIVSVLKEARNEEIKKLFHTYVANIVAKEPSAREYFNNGLRHCLKAFEDLTDGKA